MADPTTEPKTELKTEKAPVDLLKEFQELIAKQRRELGLSGTDPTPPPTPGPDPTPPPTPTPTPTPTPPPAPVSAPDYEAVIGESNAYGNLGFPINKTKKESANNSSGGQKPPARDKPKDAKGGDDIMSVIWNSIIVASYNWVLNVITNFSLDFLDYVFFKVELLQISQAKEKVAKKNIWDVASTIYTKHEKGIQSINSLVAKAHAELMLNVKRLDNGLDPKWQVWPEGKAPEFFTKLVEIYKNAKGKPDSPEAEQWAKIESHPNLMKEIFTRETCLRKIAIGMAAMEVALSDKIEQPKLLDKQIKDLEAINLSSSDEDAYTTAMQNKIEEAKKLFTEDNRVNKAINAKLNEMAQDLSDPDKKMAAKEKSISQKIEEMKKIEMVVQEIEIKEKHETYYKDLLQGIKRIRDIHKEDTDKAAADEAIKAEIKGYIGAVIETTKQAYPAINEYISPGMLDKVKGKISKNPVLKQKAEESFKKAKDSITNFEINAKTIGSYPEADIGNMTMPLMEKPADSKSEMPNISAYYMRMTGRSA